jgi:class 3 adenylate cyclase
MKSLLEKVLALKLKVQGILTSVGLRTSIDTVASVVEAERPDFRPQAGPDGTVTIMFSDIEGFTALAERLGDRRALDVLHAHNAIVREHVSAHGGFEVKSQGDWFMIAFQSARRALQCAVDIQCALAAYDVEHQEEPIRVRMGLHTGEVIREADDFFGRDVILAARIADQARGGEILVSSLLKELTENAAEIQFEEGREVELKGLSGTHVVHRVAWP